MSDIDALLVARLKTYPGLLALVNQRVYPLVLPQKPTLPAVVYQRISGPRDHTHNGPVGIAQPRYQVTAWAETPTAARAVATQIRLALDCWRPDAYGVGLILDDRDLYDPETKWYQVPADFRLVHEE